MMPNQFFSQYTKQLFRACMLTAILGSFFYTNIAYAEIPTLDQVIARIGNNIGALMEMVTAFAYVMGIYLVVMGVMELKKYGESRTMMSSEHSLKKPLILIFVGTALVFLPSSINTGLTTLWNEPVPLGYVTEAGNPWSELVGNSFIILQFIGVIAFIRGLIKLTHLTGHGGQPGQFASAMTHIIGGILCINMYDTVRLVLATLGMETVLSF